MINQRRFTRYAQVVLVYTIGVILWGAYVRATGSGAGCGNHWPLCDGTVIPHSTQIETLIEFTHRLTSGLSGLLVLVMLVWAFRLYSAGHRVRQGASLAMFFMITEGLVGAGLVLFELVAYDTSVTRAIMAAVHLVNTFFLLIALTLTVWWSQGGGPFSLKGQGRVGWLLGIGLAGICVLGASGAVTALGDTLFPAASLREGIRQDFLDTSHFLIQLRLWHPVIAIGLGVYLMVAGSLISTMRPHPQTSRWAQVLKLVFLLQLGVGGLNVALLAPVWMQLIHLLLADLVLIAFVLLGASALAQTTGEAETGQLVPQVGD